MRLDPSQLPDDVTTLKALLIASERRAAEAEKAAADAEKKKHDLAAEIETLKLTIAKLQHDRFGPSSERARLLDQLELQLGELVEVVKLSQSALSQHLARLREDGLVTFRRDSQTLHYSVIDQKALRVLGLLKEIYCGDLM